MTVKHIFLATLAAALLSACGTEDKKTENDWLPTFTDFNAEGVWTGCYDTDVNYVDINGFRFTHHGQADVYDGISYRSWYGFCPSKSTDNADYSASDWTAHQWTSITGGGVAGEGSPYLVGFWKTDGGDSSCRMTRTDGSVFYPDDLYVTNTSWGYYAMKNGSAFSRPFTDDDTCILHITGYLAGVRKFQSIQVYLAKGTNILDYWKKIELSKLGNVDTVVFTITSTDSGQWGINNPTYFCLGGMKYNLPTEYNE